MRGWTVTIAASAVLLAGCSSVVAGTPAAVAPRVPGATSTTAAPPSPTLGPPAGPRGALQADVLPDECLLNAAEAGALVGTAVRPPEQGSVPRPDGSSGAGCVAVAGTDPVLLINVYAVRGGTPADFVRSAAPGGRRDLPGVGEGAVVLDTQTGPTLQLAAPDLLVTILVTGRTPSPDAWRAAAEAALSRL